MLKVYLDELEATRDNGYISVISGNHDEIRLSHALDDKGVKLYFTMLATLPGVPFTYYGDEIGLRYLPQTSKEGGFQRTGSRTPMQWDDKSLNLGFSSAKREELYLDVDRSDGAPCGSKQLVDADSILITVKKLNILRHNTEELQADASLEILHCLDNGVLCYLRGGKIAVVFNPTDEERVLPMTIGTVLFKIGDYVLNGNETKLQPQTAVIFKLNK